MRPFGRGSLVFIISILGIMFYLILLIISDSLTKQNLFWNTLPDFLGGALGIILAFGFYELIGETKDVKKTKEIKQMLRAELENCLKLAKQQGSNLLPTVSWRLLLSTGDLRLLPFGQFRAISDIYTIIENQNYESTQLRNTNIAIMSGLTGDNEINSQKVKYQNDLANRNKQREQETSDSIQNVLNQDWWTSSKNISVSMQNQLKDVKNRLNLNGRNEFLTGVFVGLYGNWLITISSQLYDNAVISLSSVIFWLSFIPFVVFFLELTSKNRRKIGHIRFQIILGALHLIMVFIALYTNKIINTNYLFAVQGLAFWSVVVYVSQS